MKRLHLHVAVTDLPKAIGFYSGLFNARPCCAGSRYANWRVDYLALNFAASVGHRVPGALHLGLEVDISDDLQKIDRALQSPMSSAAAIPWEVSLSKSILRKENLP
ncbi:MAG TPA: hypothetical protein VFX37_12630 [Pseudolabrys sp.]|nr:hypothetical protein [Pseudolabrys sp.]